MYKHKLNQQFVKDLNIRIWIGLNLVTPLKNVNICLGLRSYILEAVNNQPQVTLNCDDGRENNKKEYPPVRDDDFVDTNPLVVVIQYNNTYTWPSVITPLS